MFQRVGLREGGLPSPLWNILHYKQPKLRKHMQHTARLFWIVEPIHTFLLLFYIAKDLPMVVLVMSKRQMKTSRTIAVAWLVSIYDNNV